MVPSAAGVWLHGKETQGTEPMDGASAVEHMNANTGGGWGCLVSARTLTKHNFRDKTKLVSHAIVSVIHRRRYTVSVENGDFGTIGSRD